MEKDMSSFLPRCGLSSCDIAIRAIAMPADTNPFGHIFGGWLMSQMDLAGGTAAQWRAGGRVATVAVDAMTFHLPVFVGDELTCYADIAKIGRTSIRMHVEAWVRRLSTGEQLKVTEGSFTYVAMGEDNKPRLIPAVSPYDQGAECLSNCPKS
jgi:acyl-CoA thioesterase YciA